MTLCNPGEPRILLLELSVECVPQGVWKDCAFHLFTLISIGYQEMLL